MRFPLHLGDGAYVHLSDYGEVILTANHHDREVATDAVVLDWRAVENLKKWLEVTETRLYAERATSSESPASPPGLSGAGSEHPHP